MSQPCFTFKELTITAVQPPAPSLPGSVEPILPDFQATVRMNGHEGGVSFQIPDHIAGQIVRAVSGHFYDAALKAYTEMQKQGLDLSATRPVIKPASGGKTEQAEELEQAEAFAKCVSKARTENPKETDKPPVVPESSRPHPRGLFIGSKKTKRKKTVFGRNRGDE